LFIYFVYLQDKEADMRVFIGKVFIVFFIISIFEVQTLKSQQLDRAVYSTSGRYSLLGVLSMEYNIGELVVFTGTITNNIVTQGFLQPNSLLITSVSSLNWMTNISVYPNPVSEQLIVHIKDSMKIGDIQIELFDILGKRKDCNLKYFPSFLGQYFSLDLSSYTAGTYFLKIYSVSTQFSETFKIIKL